MTDLTGRDIGRYHIIERLGEGGMATVYRAFDIRLEREVAIKVIRFANFAPVLVDEMLKRFEREAKSLAKMMHANIVPIYDYGEFEGSPYLVMGYVPGGTLKQWVGKPLDYRQAARLLAPVARALAYAHRQGVIHRDVKPANILLTTAGEPMLSDFGVAKILEGDSGSTLTGAGVGIGTPEYMAPEQWENQVTPQSDIYALGVVLYELVTGRVPYTADTPAAVLRMQLVEPLPRPKSFAPSLPEEVERILFKALAKKPAERYASMDDLAAALENLAGTGQAAMPAKVRTVPTLPAVEPEKPPRPEKAAGKARHVPTLQAADPSPDATWNAPVQEAHPLPAAAAGLGGWRIPLWGYLSGGLAILFLLGGVWALGANRVPKVTPTAAVVSQVTYTTASTAAQTIPTLTLAPLLPTFTFTLASSDTPAFSPPPAASPTLAPGSTRVAAKDGMVMVYIPAGPFLMGSDPARDKYIRTDEQPQHTVTLAEYWIDRTDVTNAMFSAFVQAMGYQTDAEIAGKGYAFQNGGWQQVSGANWQHPQGPGSSLQGLDQNPVVQVSWNDALAYCQWAGRRLPSEAQWEKAARGDDGRIYPWGNQLPTGNLVNFADKNLPVS